MAKAKLRDRIRQLKAHLQRAGAGQRQMEIRNQQRQQRREDIAIPVDEEVHAGEDDDRAVEAEGTKTFHFRRRNLRSTISMASLNSSIRSTHAVAASVSNAMAIVTPRRRICH